MPRWLRQKEATKIRRNSSDREALQYQVGEGLKSLDVHGCFTRKFRFNRFTVPEGHSQKRLNRSKAQLWHMYGRHPEAFVVHQIGYGPRLVYRSYDPTLKEKDLDQIHKGIPSQYFRILP